MVHAFGKFLLTTQETEAISKEPEDIRPQRITEIVRPSLNSFGILVALCHALQQGENKLTALDVFWWG
jgi:hypothetical protein